MPQMIHVLAFHKKKDTLICFREHEERAYISTAGWSLSEKQSKITCQGYIAILEMILWVGLHNIKP